MVSKASDDLPEPLRPVSTTSLSRGILSVRFLRLCSRAPPIRMSSFAITADFPIKIIPYFSGRMENEKPRLDACAGESLRKKSQIREKKVLRHLSDAVEEVGQSASARIGVSNRSAVGDDGVQQCPIHQILGRLDDVLLAQH